MTIPAGGGKHGMPRVLPGQASTQVIRALRYLSGLTNAPGLNSVAGVLEGTYANLPPSGQNPSTVYFCTDIDLLFVSDPAGLAWNAFEPVHQITLPVANQFAWLNQGTATVAFDPRMILQDLGNGTGTHKFSAQITPTPNNTGPWTAVMQSRCDLGVPQGTTVSGTSCFNNFGVVGYDSVTGKMRTWGIAWRSDFGTGVFILSYWPNQTSPTRDILMMPVPPLASPIWLSMEDDGTNRLYGYSQDSNNFNVLYSEARTVDTMTIDHAGPYLNPIGATLNQRITHSCYNWYTRSP